MSNSQKQKWQFRFLHLFFPPHLLEEIEGDLMQRYEKDVATNEVKKVKMKLAWNTLRYFRLVEESIQFITIFNSYHSQ